MKKQAESKLVPRPDYTKPAKERNRPEPLLIPPKRKESLHSGRQAKDPAEYRAEVFGDSE